MLCVDEGSEFSVSADADRLAAVLRNVVQNAQDATDKLGRVEVRLAAAREGVSIESKDDGCGMDESFVPERPFRPFDSAKGLSGMGIGP